MLFFVFIAPAFVGLAIGNADPTKSGLLLDNSSPIEWSNDGCHPNNKGYTQLARYNSIHTYIHVFLHHSRMHVYFLYYMSQDNLLGVHPHAIQKVRICTLTVTN